MTCPYGKEKTFIVSKFYIKKDWHERKTEKSYMPDNIILTEFEIFMARL